MNVLLLVIASLVGLFGTIAKGEEQRSGDVVRTEHLWTCDRPVDLDLVHVSIPAGPREDAVHLRPGCTGRIGRLEVEQRSGDGVKVAEGVHDLTVDGGTVRCLAKAPRVHQDGIQVLGGERIRFRNLSISCGRPGARLVNSNFFVNQAGRSSRPPTDIVCESCSFGGWAAHTVSIQRSIRSGIVDSTICVARYPRLTLTIGEEADAPVVHGNSVKQCDAGRLTLEPYRQVVTFGRPLELRGALLGGAPGSKVVVESRPAGKTAFVRAGSAKTRGSGRFKLVLRPRVGGQLRVSSGALSGPVLSVAVRPHVVLRHRGEQLVARVRAGRPYAGRLVSLQALRHGRWVTVQRVRLDSRSRARFRPQEHGVRVRAAVGRAPGYVAAHSEPLRLG